VPQTHIAADAAADFLDELRIEMLQAPRILERQLKNYDVPT
jgi:hypothetical protein